ncbi:MAG: glycogen/starch/alpha-glucan phosphorylase [Leptospiraceae bacterium]|nr:glycogen/starch/alpha-glucan phosphorylase [Leptospiraceae bacterium]MCB1303798.1 glycogen/starch/alpha-glucan phosphorylase [Leptospiraceae bacterium]
MLQRQSLVNSVRLKELLGLEQKLDPDSIKRHFAHHLEYTVGKYKETTHAIDIYQALAYTIRDSLIDRYNATQENLINKKARRVYYLSMEFLLGRLLRSNLINLDAIDYARTLLKEIGVDLESIEDCEMDAGLGNGGLGRLAACFMESSSTMDLACQGAGLYYNYGIFNQRIEHGHQRELPDDWLKEGNPWAMERIERTYAVHFYGRTESYKKEDRHLVRWMPGETVLATANDILIPGYRTRTVNPLRLWKARANNEFDFTYFNHGDYFRAVEDKLHSENITHVLYPNENNLQGKELRLKQEFFLVSATIQDAMSDFFDIGDSIEDLPEKVFFQLNDTHPAVAVAELMRILMDGYELEFDRAWELASKCFGYTNHTVMPEALEKWDLELFGRMLPRHLEIIYLINHRFLEWARSQGADDEAVSRLSIIDERHPRKVRMANLAIVGATAVNGVAAIHSEIIKKDVFPDFARIFANRFQNKTNGITFRRWLIGANPELSGLITSHLGQAWTQDLTQLKKLEEYAENEEFQEAFYRVKLENKLKLASIIHHDCGVDVNPESIFDAQIKRIHEYKRQLLNVLRIIADYQAIKENPSIDYFPRTFIFGGKAAPGYHRAKLIVRLIHAVGERVNSDTDVAGRIKVVFLPNYRVSLAERIFPATDLSEQISTAGTEASGTGNMKFMLNGALTVGTLDGANIEIKQEVGDENIFIFGRTVDEINNLRTHGYDPVHLYQSDNVLNRVLESIHRNEFAPHEPGIFQEIFHTLTYGGDYYFLMEDFRSYLDIQKKIEQEYRDQKLWRKKAILNTARSSFFSSDRTIQQYASEIWKLEPIKHF